MERTWIHDAADMAGQTATFKGWAKSVRVMGDKLVFIDLRDGSGILQVVCYKPDLSPEVAAAVDSIKTEYVLEIEGEVKARGAKQAKEGERNGAVELSAKRVAILNACETPPFEIDKDTSGINEELRLKYRYLDLRSDRMHRNMWKRSAITRFIREHLYGEHFTEVETPILTKGTPEGAREFLVPSRVHPGKFYVLPQSPQQHKQLLMVAGKERYFQIARCFRDEDQRGDRQPEFTQVDLEMSFVEREDVMGLIEGMLVKLVKEQSPEKRIQQVPFPRMSYKESMEKYGNDRPDIREDKNDPNLLAFCWVIDFPFFEKTEDGGPSTGSGQGWTFTHNPFSRAVPEHREALMGKKDIGSILTSQYDVVLNGFEIGGGSIRNHEPEALQRVFEIMGFALDDIKAQFGHMLEAFPFGAPPHGGIALGLDRLIALLCNEPNIREVIAFPKTGDARDPMMGAPSDMPEKALREVHIRKA
ncbi:aspartate--tRNA ligase [Patescibacteria group bacterium]|nr:MAG: aspartate--tRNA ligase [Patescibacteria group bacterium]